MIVHTCWSHRDRFRDCANNCMILKLFNVFAYFGNYFVVSEHDFMFKPQSKLLSKLDSNSTKSKVGEHLDDAGTKFELEPCARWLHSLQHMLNKLRNHVCADHLYLLVPFRGELQQYFFVHALFGFNFNILEEYVIYWRSIMAAKSKLGAMLIPCNKLLTNILKSFSLKLVIS